MSDPRYTGTHPNVVIGVMVIALVMLFRLFFWVSLVVSAFLVPIEVGRFEPVLADYLNLPRVAWSLGTAAVASITVWTVVSEPA